MRPVLIALIAGCLPLGAYAHQDWTLSPSAKAASQRTEAAAAPGITTPVVTADNATVEKSGDAASGTPDAPSKEPPPCTSPAVSAWNPAATGEGRICTPTQWAAAKPFGRG